MTWLAFKTTTGDYHIANGGGMMLLAFYDDFTGWSIETDTDVVLLSIDYVGEYPTFEDLLQYARKDSRSE